jgi:hypothetical protein
MRAEGHRRYPFAFFAMTLEQIDELNSSLIELIKSYRLMADEITEEQLESFADNHPLADVLFEAEAYLEQMELINA